MDTSKLAKLAAEFMDHLDKDFEGERELEFGEVVMIAEVMYRNEDGQLVVSVGTASTTTNRVHQTGIATWGLEQIKDHGVPAEGEEDFDGD